MKIKKIFFLFIALLIFFILAGSKKVRAASCGVNCYSFTYGSCYKEGTGCKQWRFGRCPDGRGSSYACGDIASCPCPVVPTAIPPTANPGICNVKCTSLTCQLEGCRQVGNGCSRKMCYINSVTYKCCSSYELPCACPNPTVTLAPTTVISPTGQISGTIVPTQGVCTKKAQGDANCDGTINLQDFEAWRAEFVGGTTTKTADFNKDTKIDNLDFEIWRKTIIAQ